ncbi:MAG: hypothetical protein KY455_12190, partial [Euryarchaeota archaeon]|nr:hypothetical protein [Euryarchaeota archaeon]
WVEVYVEANDLLAGVEARDDGGEWVTLTKRSWGAWAASFHVEDGSLVDFRATSTDGGTDISGEYRWPEGTQVSEEPGDGGGGTAPSGFDASYSAVGGNEWWIQTKVDANEPLSGVDTRVDGGEWKAMDLKDWGSWAVSVHAPEGSLIQFRATSTDGDRDFSTGGWVWTHATPYPSDGQVAAFHNVKGNSGWVQVNVYSEAPLESVEARLDARGSWIALDQQDWGDWARALDAPDGTHVQFRATTTGGQVALSETWRWTDQEPLGMSEVWPQAGSHVSYETGMSFGSPGGYPRTIEDINVTLVYDGEQWRAECEGWREEYDHNGDLEERTRIQETGTFSPPRGASLTGVRVGEHARVETVGCEKGLHRSVFDIVEKTTRSSSRDGETVASPAWKGVYIPEWNEYAEAHWHTKTGLVLEWRWSATGGGFGGDLVSTDAPIGPDDPAPRPPQRDTWPFEESHASYAVEEGAPEDPHIESLLDLTYQGGYWQGVCDATDHISEEEPVERRIHVPYAPGTGPTAPTPGSVVGVGTNRAIEGCEPMPLTVVASHEESYQTTQDGEAVTTTAWYGHETDAAAVDGHAFDAWWDSEKGLALEWRTAGDRSFFDRRGILTDTDAPLAD